jgi:outer membrane lipoprotein LolB
MDMEMRIYHLKLVLLFLSLLTLTSCVTTPSNVQSPQNAPITWENRVGTLSSIENWNLQGLIAIRTQKDAFTANWQWQQQKDHRYSISLFGPLGSNAVQLTGSPGQVLLETSDGKKITSTSPESLLEQQLGWRLPVSSLYYWVRGLPVPNVSAQKQFDAYHHLTTLIQQNWTVQYLQYISVNHIDLPRKIALSNSDLNVKIVVNRWSI